MADFTVRSDAIDVEEIMRQIRARIRDKRGVDYTEEQIQELAGARLERFLDPRGVRSELLEQFRKQREGGPPPSRSYAFEDTTLFESDKPLIRFVRRLLKPVLKLFFNYNVLNHVLHTQAAINQSRDEQDLLAFEVMHNLVVEMTRTSIEVKSLRMKLESVQSRLEFNERRARALEAVVQYKPEAEAATRGDAPPLPGSEAQGGVDPITGGESLRTRRRRRRRGRRTTGPGAPAGEAAEAVNGTAGDEDHQQGPGANRFRAPDDQDALQRASPKPSAEAGSQGPADHVGQAPEPGGPSQDAGSLGDPIQLAATPPPIVPREVPAARAQGEPAGDAAPADDGRNEPATPGAQDNARPRTDQTES